MRELADEGRIREFMRALGREAESPGRVFLTGGATAVLLGFRSSTLDVDIKLVPDQDRVLRAIPGLKESLRLNVELAAPDQFIPVPRGWAERSPFITQEGRLGFHHYDLTAQTLAKIERGHAQDVSDVREMLARGQPEQFRCGPGKSGRDHAFSKPVGRSGSALFPGRRWRRPLAGTAVRRD